MTPIGPYVSPFADKSAWIIKTGRGIGVVVDGEQPSSSTMHPTMADAKKWLVDNGYAPKE